MNCHCQPRMSRAWLALALLIGTCTNGVSAQQPPAGPAVRLVVPFPAGTTIDILARDLAAKLPAALGRPVVVDNRAGASGNIGTDYVVNAPADGSTLLVTVHSSVTINPLIYEKLRFNPLVDLVPVANLITGGYLLAAGPKVPHRTVSELVAAGKQNPGAITYASYGYGSMAHICMEKFQASTGARFRHVPYKSAFMSDLLAGHVDIAFENIGAAIPQVEQKKLTPIALSHTRLQRLPGVAAVSEAVPGFECYAWVGVLAPKGLPAGTQRRLSDEINKIVRAQAFTTLAEGLGSTPAPMDVDQFGAFIRADADKWNKLIPPLNIKLD